MKERDNYGLGFENCMLNPEKKTLSVE